MPPAPSDSERVLDILTAMQDRSVSIIELIAAVLDDNEYAEHEAGSRFVADIDALLVALTISARTKNTVETWALQRAKKIYCAEVQLLSQKKNGLHFNAHHATHEQLASFNLSELANNMSAIAPSIWDLLDVLLCAGVTRRVGRRRKSKGKTRDETAPVPAAPPAHEAAIEDDSEEEYWRDFKLQALDSVSKDGEDDDGEASDEEDGGETGEDDWEAQSVGIATTKKIVCTSIILQSTNQRCNALQSTVGIFLHSCSAPQSIIDFLSRIGVSIAQRTIDQSISSLSREAGTEIRRLGRTLLAAFAYDNFDVDIKQLVPTVENPHENLLHLTSGTLLRLEHGVTRQDLSCNEALWDDAPHNPKNHRRTYGLDWTKLLKVHPEPPSPNGLSRRNRFNAWIFLRDLVMYGPAYFRKFSKDLGTPELVDAIPVVKSKQVPFAGMDINQSTVQGNADALTEMCRQAGIGDSRAAGVPGGTTDLGDHVVLVHGDLSTCERVQSLQASRADEATPWRRAQWVVFVPGLFHLKMACADAIWRIFISSKESREDATSLMKQIQQIRPKETQKIGSKPGFRRMHEVIQHVGIASRLDCWRVKASKSNSSWASLDEWAASEPTWDDLQVMVCQLVRESLPEEDFSEKRSRPAKSRDQEHENVLLREQYFLLYEELSYAMNVGDVGRVETCFMPWVFIFKGCGKHKYANQMMKFLNDLHFVYPEGLRRAIRMNILCNPTGRAGAFRAIDWLMEHNNLYIKRIYGGRFSNHTKAHILKESVLIQTFKDVRMSFEQMFALNHRSFRHAPPRLEKTLRKLQNYMAQQKTHIEILGRSSRYNVQQAMAIGAHRIVAQGRQAGMGADEEVDETGDIELDGEDGDLAV